MFATPLGLPSNAVSWRTQGRRRGQGATGAIRGPYNEGGLFGKREGWPGADGHDPRWTPATLPTPDRTPGVTWCRTDLVLALPKAQDTSLGIRIEDPAARHYRAILYVNGWKIGNYVSTLLPFMRSVSHAMLDLADGRADREGSPRCQPANDGKAIMRLNHPR